MSPVPTKTSDGDREYIRDGGQGIGDRNGRIRGGGRGQGTGDRGQK